MAWAWLPEIDGRDFFAEKEVCEPSTDWFEAFTRSWNSLCMMW